MKKLLILILLATTVVACKQEPEINNAIMDIDFRISVENASGQDLFGENIDNKWTAADITVFYLDGTTKKKPLPWGHIDEYFDGFMISPKKDELNRTRINFYASDFMTNTDKAEMLTGTSEIHWPNGDVNIIKCTVRHPAPGYLFMEEIYIDGKLLWSKSMRIPQNQDGTAFTADYRRDFVKVVTSSGSTIKLWEDSNYYN